MSSEDDIVRTAGRRAAGRMGALLAACGVLMMTSACSGNSRFALNGDVTVSGRGVIASPTAGAVGCMGFEGYSDMRPGASVTVSNAAGEVVALGELGQGVSGGSGTCRFPFMVADVPSGADFYRIEVSHRGAVTVKAADATAGNVHLSLGG